jgi:hypothetical protein
VPEAPPYSLTRQIVARLALALLVTMMSTVALGLWFYSHAKQRFLETHLRLSQEHYAAELSLKELEWERAAYNFKARLEYSRALESRDGRQARLGNFITAQGGSPEYPLVLVFDRSGERIAVFAYGQTRIVPPVFDSGNTGWAYDEDDHRLFRVFRQQVWLGEDQNGFLVIYRPLDHALLGSLT